MSKHHITVELDLGDEHLGDVELDPDPAEWTAADLAHFIYVWCPGIRGTAEIIDYTCVEEGSPPPEQDEDAE